MKEIVEFIAALQNATSIDESRYTFSATGGYVNWEDKTHWKEADAALRKTPLEFQEEYKKTLDS